MSRPAILTRRQCRARYAGKCVGCGNRYEAGRVVTLASLGWAHPRCEPVHLERTLERLHALTEAELELELAGRSSKQVHRLMLWIVDRGLSYRAQLVFERAFDAAAARERRDGPARTTA
jgi:hypothetical protein